MILGLIDAARTRAYQAVNTSLIDLYWAVGEHISGRVASAGWGQGAVRALGAMGPAADKRVHHFA